MSSATYSPVMWLRSLEEAAAEQAAEQNAAIGAASAPTQDPAQSAPSQPHFAMSQPVASRSSERNGKADNEDDDDSGSDDSGSELPAGPTSTTGLPFPRTFNDFRKYWGTRLKDIAAQFGVPESGLSKVRHLVLRWPLSSFFA